MANSLLISLTWRIFAAALHVSRANAQNEAATGVTRLSKGLTMEAFRFRSSALDGCNVFMSVYEDMLAWAARVHTFSCMSVGQTDRRTPTGYDRW